jgi:hypothetical protein
MPKKAIKAIYKNTFVHALLVFFKTSTDSIVSAVTCLVTTFFELFVSYISILN